MANNRAIKCQLMTISDHWEKKMQNNKIHNKALQLIHKSGAPVVAPLLLSTELNR